MKLYGLVHNFYTDVSINDLYIPTIGPQTQYTEIGGPIVGIGHRYMNAEIGNERSFISGNICFEFSVPRIG